MPRAEGIKLRKVRESDEEVTYAWVNDPEIRRYAVNRHQVSLEEHRSWFRKKLNDPLIWFYIMEDVVQNPVGSIRFDQINDELQVSYLISPQYQGRGYGRSIVMMGLEMMQREKGVGNKVVGWVYRSNKASIRIFQSLEFDVLQDEQEMIKFSKKL